MRTDHSEAHSGLPAICSVADTRIPVRPVLALFSALVFAQPLLAADEVVTTVFGTDVVPTQWLITGAGVTDAPATPVIPYPGFISFSSTSFPGGVFIPGASQAAFDGAWNADLSFAIPRQATDIRLQFHDLFADDNVVVLLNGSSIGNSTFFGSAGTYLHQFGPGETAVPFAFTETTQDTVSGDDSVFIIGDKDPRGTENTLRLSVNNIVGGVPGPLNSTGDGTAVRMRASITWTEDYQIRPYPNPQGDVVQVDDDPHGWYNAVTFVNSGALVVDAGGVLTNRAGAWLDNTGSIQNNGQIILQGQYSSLPDASFINNGAMSVAGTMEEYGAFINTGSLGILSSGSFLYRGQGDGDVFLSSGRIYNQGRFEVTGPGARFSGGRSSFTNTNELVVNGDASFDGDVSNTGKVSIDAAVMTGEIRNDSFAEVRISGGGGVEGAMTNEGSVFLANSSVVASKGSRIVNRGLIDATAGSHVIVAGASDLVNDGESAFVFIRPGAFLNVQAGSNLDNFSGLLDVSGSATIRGNVSNADNISIGGGGQVHMGADVQNIGVINILSGSLLEIESTGHLFAYSPGLINLQYGGVLANQGLIEDNTLFCAGGRITGRGTIAASVTMNLDGCTIGPGNSPGTLTILGALDLSSSTVELEIGSPDDYDRLVTDGPVQIDGGLVEVSFVDGYLPDEMDSFAWLSGSDINAVDVSYHGFLPSWTFQSSADGAGAQVSMASADAVDLGFGGTDDVVNGAGQVAFVDRTEESFSEYSNEAQLDNSGVLHNREGSRFRNYGLGYIGTLLNRAGAWFVNRGQFMNDFVASVQNSGTFYNHATGVVQNEGEFVNAAGGRLVNRGLITNGGGGSIFRNEGHVENRGEIVNSDAIENSGLFEIATGATVHGDGSNFSRYTQAGGETRVNGVLNANEIIFYGGRLTGIGQVAGDVTMAEAFLAEGATIGTIDPGDILGTGTLSVTGDVTMRILHIDLASATLYDVLAIDGEIVDPGLPMTLEVSLLNGYNPGLGDHFDYLVALNGRWGGSGYFNNMILPALNADLAWASDYLVDGALTSYRLEVVAAAVPAPGTLGLLGTGLGAVLMRLRRRRPTH